MLAGFFDVLFGCTHKRFSFPITSKPAHGRGKTGTYVACLDCGKEFAYDWEHMKILPEGSTTIHEPAESSILKAA